jgi:hypothetical protein
MHRLERINISAPLLKLERLVERVYDKPFRNSDIEVGNAFANPGPRIVTNVFVVVL